MVPGSVLFRRYGTTFPPQVPPDPNSHITCASQRFPYTLGGRVLEDCRWLTISSSWITLLEYLCCLSWSRALVLSSWIWRVNVLAVLEKPLKNRMLHDFSQPKHVPYTNPVVY